MVSGKSLTANGTVTTSGTTAGFIAFQAYNASTIAINKATSAGTGANVTLFTQGTGAISVAKDATITAAAAVNFDSGATGVINIASGANISAGTNVDDGSSAGTLNLGANITTTAGNISIDTMAINLTGAVALKAQGVSKAITLGAVNGAQALSLNNASTTTAAITTGAIGGTTPLTSVTVVQGGNTTFGDLNAASVVLTDSTGTINFGGNTVVTKSLTTAAKAYGVTFTGATTVLSGAPVFLNTGNVSFSGTTSLTTGATITGTAATTVN
ncbi:MAG: hypothetical protein EBQ87_08175, partial [Planctomycetes bacterium]|nr:hypothetical protein [Planctomycetota bacterium]